MLIFAAIGSPSASRNLSQNLESCHQPHIEPAIYRTTRQLREFLGKAVPIMIPFFAFALVASIDLKTVWHAGLLGLGLGLFVIVVTGTGLFSAGKFTGGTGVGGLATATTAGNAAAKPATILVSASLVVTAILVPFITAWWANHIGQGHNTDPLQAQESTAATGAPTDPEPPARSVPET